MRALARSSLLAPFQVRSFRYQYPADLLTSWGTEMENLILGWYILVTTGSVVLLTLFRWLLYAEEVEPTRARATPVESR